MTEVNKNVTVYVSKDGIEFKTKELCEDYEKKSLQIYDDMICKMNYYKSIILPRCQKKVDFEEALLKRVFKESKEDDKIVRTLKIGNAYLHLHDALTAYKKAQKDYAKFKKCMRDISKSYGIRKNSK